MTMGYEKHLLCAGQKMSWKETRLFFADKEPSHSEKSRVSSHF